MFLHRNRIHIFLSCFVAVKTFQQGTILKLTNSIGSCEKFMALLHDLHKCWYVTSALHIHKDVENQTREAFSFDICIFMYIIREPEQESQSFDDRLNSIFIRIDK
jgi:hypothetical protein